VTAEVDGTDADISAEVDAEAEAKGGAASS